MIRPPIWRGLCGVVVLFLCAACASTPPLHADNNELPPRFPDYNANPLPADPSGMSRTATEIAREISLGWNLGNTLEAIGGETNWGNPPVSEALFKLVKSQGFDAVRIPASWDQYADPDTAEINCAWLQRVKDVVGYGVDNGLYIVLNIHWDGGWLENNVDASERAAVIAKQRAYWQQIATAMRDFDEHLVFAGSNEPAVESASQMRVLDDYHQAFVDAVRETGGRNAYRVLVVQGPVTDIERTTELWNDLPKDTVAERLMMELHFYTPYNFTLMSEDQDWGQQFYYWGQGFHSPTDKARNPTWGEERTVAKLLDQARRQFVAQGIPVIIGEYAAMRRDNLRGTDLERHLAARNYYLEYVTRQSLANGLVPFYWDTGGLDKNGSGLFDRHRLEVFDQSALEALRRAAEPAADVDTAVNRH